MYIIWIIHLFILTRHMSHVWLITFNFVKFYWNTVIYETYQEKFE